MISVPLWHIHTQRVNTAFMCVYITYGLTTFICSEEDISSLAWVHKHWKHSVMQIHTTHIHVHTSCGLINKPYYWAGLTGSYSKLVCQQLTQAALWHTHLLLEQSWTHTRKHTHTHSRVQIWTHRSVEIYTYPRMHTCTDTLPHRWTCNERQLNRTDKYKDEHAYTCFQEINVLSTFTYAKWYLHISEENWMYCVFCNHHSTACGDCRESTQLLARTQRW